MNTYNRSNKRVLLPPVEPSQFTSIRYGERLDEIGAKPSIGTVADSYDNALAESMNASYKSELIRNKGPWRNVDEVELATMGWVNWFNETRLHESLDDIPPAEFEARYYTQMQADQMVGIR
jgi:putative transposase